MVRNEHLNYLFTFFKDEFEIKSIQNYPETENKIRI